MGQALCSPIFDASDICVRNETTADSKESDEKAKDDFFARLAEKNKKAMTCAHLIASIIRLFFESSENVCDLIPKWTEDTTIDSQSILDNMLIIGSAPRNYILKRTISCIDIAVNTRELAKMMYAHLNQHHSSEKAQKSASKCIFWRIYMNKFREPESAQTERKSQQMMRKKYEYIADCDYLLNAAFFVDYVLKLDIISSLRDKLSIHRDETTKVYQCEIIDEMKYPKYNSVDLDGQQFSIFDVTDNQLVHKQLFGTLSTQRRLKQLRSIHAKHRQKLQQLKTEMAAPSDTEDDDDINDDGFEFEDRELSETELSVASQQSGYGTLQKRHVAQLSITHSFSMGGSRFVAPMSRNDSLQVFQIRVNDAPFSSMSKKAKKSNGKEEKESKVLPIELPVYKIRFKDILKLMAFSIDTVYVRMGDVLDLNKKKIPRTNMDKEKTFENYEDEYTDSFDNVAMLTPAVNDDVVINYDWRDKVEKNGLENYDALADFKQKRLTHPEVENVIRFHGAPVYFWKIVRFGVLLSSWQIDKTLITYTKQDYSTWLLSNEYWSNKANYEWFVHVMFSPDICYNQSLKQYKRMLSLFSMLDAHSKLQAAMAKHVPFRGCFVKHVQRLKAIEKSEIIAAFSKQGYPMQ